MSAISQANNKATTYDLARPISGLASESGSRSTTRVGGGADSSSGGAGGVIGDDGNPQTRLRGVKGKNGFLFPAIWSFPPFFTLQPNPQTQAHQISLWSSLILDWARFAKVWEVNVESSGGELGEVFENRGIRRRLMPASIRTVLAAMVKDGRAAPHPPKQQNNHLLYWKRPDEWGTEIYDWVVGNGMAGSIMTMWEIGEGEVSEGQDFYGMPPALLRRVIDTLVKRGKAQIIKGEGEAGEGVRFL